ncbi:MAG: prolyl oligopeptidase family serine peptidase [Bacteroidales bacterium]|jgi:dipeptidyl aminopeptidase/acylaminoacyl peptidase|nr:prolyl oligopeptidase family serine peptidase [Bacteroidales bacterium]
MKNTYITLALCFIGLGIQAQDTVKYFNKIGNVQIGIRTPFIIDSINNHQKGFSTDDYFVMPTLNEIKKDIKSETDVIINKKNSYEVKDGVLKISIDSGKRNVCVPSFYFQLNNEAFAKGKISVYTPQKVKVSLDGKEAGKRMSKKDSLNSDAKVDCEVSLEPGGHIVCVSLLCDSSDREIQLQVVVNVPQVSISGKQILKRGLTLQDILEGTSPYDVSMTDDGKYYMVKYYTGTIGEKNKYKVEVRKTENNDIVWTSTDITSVKWTPSFRFLNATLHYLYYVKEENKVRNLYLIEISNQVEEPILVAENFPEGKIEGLLNFAGLILSITDKEDNSKDDLRQLIHPDDRIGGWRNRSNLALYSKFTPILQPLTFGHHNVTFNDYSEETNSILFTINEEDVTQRPFSKNTLVEMKLETFEVDTILSDSFISYAQYMKTSNDKNKAEFAKKHIIVQGSGEAFGSCGAEVKKGQTPNIYNNLLFLFDRTTKQAKPLLNGFKPSVNGFKVVADNQIFITTTDKDSVNVYYYNFDTLYRLPLSVDIVGGFDIDLSGEHYVYYGQNYNKSNRVFVGNLKTKECKQIAYPKEEMNEQLALGEMKVWNFKHKGDLIEGRYYLPADFDSTKQYPMIVYYYGGTTPTDRMFEMRYSAYLYTAQGYVVYVLNPSGSIGYGQEFAARHVNAWGDRTADEIIYGVKQFCKEHSFVNSKRIGCMGASYGGFMTQLLQTKTDIFAAAVSHAGISDITSYWGEGYWGYSYSAAASANSYPWNNKRLFVEHSPLFAADKIKTPLLLLHGTDDTNVPIGESIQMFNALKLLGKEVAFITVKGENHGIMDHKKRIAWNNTIYAWFAKWLKDDASWWDTLYPQKDF